MRIVVAAIGRLKQGPERELAERYRKRAADVGRRSGVRDVEVIEIKESRAQDAARRKLEESIALASLIPDKCMAVLFEQRGLNLDSATFTDSLRRWRDAGVPEVVFIIGGPDGLAPSLHEKADLHLALGAATWPHQLLRIMVLEQLYRAMSILAGHPYHRA
jgi:23S rRNA (pseudouridine1915-N3)-methyltransferase